MELRLPTSIIKAELSKYDSSAISIETLPNWVLYDLNILHRYLLCVNIGLSEEYVRLNLTDNLLLCIKDTILKIKDNNTQGKFLMVCKELSRIFDTEKLSSLKKGEVLKNFLDCYYMYFKLGYPTKIQSLYDFELFMDISNNGVGYEYLHLVPDDKRYLLSVSTEQNIDNAIMIINKFETRLAYQLLKLDISDYTNLMGYAGTDYFNVLLECLKNGLDITDISYSDYNVNILYNIVVAKNNDVDILKYDKNTTNKEILNDINLAKLGKTSFKSDNFKFI